MKKLTIFVSLLCSVIFSSHLLIAQTDCATELSEELVTHIKNIEQSQQASNEDFNESVIIEVPVTAHIIRDSLAKGGLTEDSLLTSIEQLNEAFEQTNFQFSLCSTNYIDNSDYYFNLSISNELDSTEFRMALPNLVVGTINIFYAPNITKSWASFPFHKIIYDKDWIVMNNAQATNGSTLAHEMGHYFNLYHTHEIAFGTELIDGTNCKEAGDLVCDTSAEPFVNSRGGDGLQYCISQACTYICDESYMPNVDNIMSYASSNCRTSFSPGQINRMHQSYMNDREYLMGDCEQIAVKPCETSDRAALIALYDATDGPNWKNTWDLGTDYKTWYGVSVNEDGCVIELNLGYNNLTGNIPAEIGSLDFLKHLNLFSNQLEGEVPIEIGKLENLEHLILENNALTGSIPSEIGNLSQLEYLIFKNNQLTGNLPETLTDLNNLKTINFKNNLLSGCYEPKLKALCDRFWRPTDDLVSKGNNFDASFGDFCANNAGICENDETCIISDKEALIALYNSTDGSNWKNTWDLSLDHKDWYGVIVNEDGCVIELNLGYNNLTGNIPAEIGSLDFLKHLNLFSNQLEGEVPIEIGKLENLEHLILENNALTGSIPSEIGNLSQLEYLIFKNNQLTGNLPETLTDLNNLKTINFKNNLLSGCYEPKLKALCDRFWRPTDDLVSKGNNFDASFGDFCAFDAGICEPDNNNFIAGDYNKNGRVDHIDALYLGVSYGKTGIACGATDQNKCPDWEEEINGINAKYLDGDQNGVINKNDAQAIHDNYGATSGDVDSLSIDSKAFSLKLHLTEDLAGRKFTFDIFINDLEEAYTEIQGLAGCIHLHNLSIYVAYSRFYQRDFEKSILINNHNPETNSLDFAITFPEKITLKPNKPIGELVIVVKSEINVDDCIIEIADFITINAKAELSQGLNSTYNGAELNPKLNSLEKNSLSQNKPNPFSEQTVINYVIPQAAEKAQLNLYTLAGTLVQTTAIEHRGAGSLVLKSNNLLAGLYVYSLLVDGKSTTSKKMIVQK